MAPNRSLHPQGPWLRRCSTILLSSAVALGALAATRARPIPSADLSLEQRLAAQRAIDEVNQRHRLLPGSDRASSRGRTESSPESAAQAAVEDYLRTSSALEARRGRPITRAELEAEVGRITRDSRDPARLLELFAALGNNGTLIAECIARPALAARLLAELDSTETAAPPAATACSNDSWRTMGASPLAARRGHTAVWTGTEMIVWGGNDGSTVLSSGARYYPATDSWSSMATGPNVPAAREAHTAVWTGSEMIVWGGTDGTAVLRTGGRYDPASNSWTGYALANGAAPSTPAARSGHTAVWTGSEMIVWGGTDGATELATGGRFNPVTDSWSASSLTAETSSDVPAPRQRHTAIWTGSEMIVWGGSTGSTALASGGRYSPATDSWNLASLTSGSGANVPAARRDHTAVWSGTEMIVWGGSNGSTPLATGGRYNPLSDNWTSSSLVAGTGANVPAARSGHVAVWTGLEMIVWGGSNATSGLATGARYRPAADSWSASSLVNGTGPNVPSARSGHTGIWTGVELLIWGGSAGSLTASGARYCGCASSHAYRADADGDGFGSAAAPSFDCAPQPPAGFVANQMDCNDADPAVGPATIWFADADGDGYGNPATGMVACSQPPGLVAVGTDCDDTRAAVRAGAAELCDNIDNDCNGAVDETSCPRYVAISGSDVTLGLNAANLNYCGVAATPCRTIGRAVSAAVSGDSIHVGAGAYGESVLITKALSLLGPKAGIPGSDPSRGTGEATISSPDGSSSAIVADAVTALVDGFDVVGPNQMNHGAAVALADGLAGRPYRSIPEGALTNVTVRNCVVRVLQGSDLYLGDGIFVEL